MFSSPDTCQDPAPKEKYHQKLNASLDESNLYRYQIRPINPNYWELNHNQTLGAFYYLAISVLNAETITDSSMILVRFFSCVFPVSVYFVCFRTVYGYFE